MKKSLKVIGALTAIVSIAAAAKKMHNKKII